MNRNFGKLNTTRKNLNLQLDLNQNFKDAPDLSLVEASNIKIANDGEYILSNNSVRIVEPIYNAIKEHLSGTTVTTYIIKYILPCNNELIVFAYTRGYREVDKNKFYLNLFRYNEKTNICKVCLNHTKIVEQTTGWICMDGGLPYYGGEFTGTFTYNANNDLIIAICEYDSIFPTPIDVGQPMMIINLGHWNEDETEIINNSNLNPKTFPLCPEVEIPNPYNVEIIDGYSKKGWYNFFIRYKIDDYNYTKWYSIGDSIYLDEIEEKVLFEHFQGIYTENETEHIENKLRKIVDYIGTDKDICNKTIKFELELDKVYKAYQIGFTCSTKTYIESKHTNDINIEYSNYIIKHNFILDYKNTNDIDKNEFILNYQNYFNVKNIINYNNRIYISNYKENYNINIDLLNYIDNNITYKIEKTELNYTNAFYYVTVYNKSELVDENLITTPITKEVKENFTLYDLYSEDKEQILFMKYDRSIIHTSMTYTLFRSLLGEDNKNYFTVAVFCNASTGNPVVSVCGYFYYNNPGEKATPFIKDEDISVYDCIEKVNNGTFILKRYIYKLVTEANNITLSLNKSNNTFKIDWNESLLDYILVAYDPIKKYSTGDFRATYTIIETYIDRINSFTELKITIPNEYSYNSTKPIYITDLNKINYSLIPGQIYNFYIHFIDKYGNASDGIKLSPLTKEAKNQITIINYNRCILINTKSVGGELYRLYIKLNKNIFIKNSTYYNEDYINKDSLILIYVNKYEESYEYDFEKYYDIPEEFKTFINDTLEFVFEDIPDYIKQSDSIYSFGEILKDMKYERIVNLSYFYSSFLSRDGNDYFYIPINENYNNDKNINIIFNFDSTNISNFSNYISYFYSYEKIDNLLINQGIDCEGFKTISNSFNTDDGIIYCGELDEYNNRIGVSLKLSNDNLNFNDSINIGGDKLYITKIEEFKKDYFTLYLNVENNIEVAKSKDIKINIANAINDDNLNIQTNIYFKDIFKGNSIKDNAFRLIKMYKNEINIYNNSIKTLIKCSDYVSINNNIETNIKPYSHWALGSALIFNNFGYRYDSEKHIKYYDNSKFYTNEINVLNIKFLQIVDDFQEFKQFNNPPQSLVIIKNNVSYDDKSAQYYYGMSFLCQDTVDLFKNNTLKHDDSIINIYTNYDEKRLNKINYDKTIRRSNYIKDESLEIGWRKFELDNYKNITENKGNITNLVGIGDLLLVHTEHSLFQFDKNNLLVAANKSVQLGQQDTFDVDYKEIFTSNFGFGGLQDKNSFIIGEFGYIYYNSDFCKLYRYDAGQINDIGINIYAFLNQFRPKDVRFVEDKENKLIYCRFQLDNDYKELSYNYDKKTFISNHSFPFITGYNTKIKSYFIDDFELDNQVYSLLFNKDSIRSNVCSWNYLSNNTFKISYLTNTFTFIINPNYDKLKVLNSISYKLYKRDTYNIDDTNNIKQPIPEFYDPITNLVPYSGEKLRIYNDICDSGEIDISTNSKGTPNNTPDYTKPYWNLGEFNFNYFRNINIGGHSRIVGNYFLVQFKFTIGKKDIIGVADTSLIEFQSLNYSVTEY